MTDVPDASGQIPRRSPRVGDGGAPVSGALAIVLAVVAVVAGFLILRSISDSGENTADFPEPGQSQGGAPSGGEAATNTTNPGDSVATLPPTTTTPPLVVEGASVVVANANGQGGSASAMSRALEAGYGFTVVDPTNASSTIPDLDETVIYYLTDVAAAQTVADSLGRVLGGVSSVAPMPETPPTQDGQLNGAEVLLMLGKDKANKTLEELAPDLAGGSGNVVTVTNPDPSGTTTTTTG
ncbi:LytR C-terminal domain-containing protein [Ilumatobacter sp.]|uniref:LytR C-terminal domain-containing protein n=1 Tax=Ilumatobacter sp. TaxID=1967498 RepID=UPI003AF79640